DNSSQVEEDMPPRRSHKKSRNGCDQCKKRRVKCDETGPPCSMCSFRELECTFGGSSAHTVQHDVVDTPSLSPPVTGTSFDATNRTRTILINRFPLRALELMHKFSTETYQSLSNAPTDDYGWQFTVPEKALDHDFLMSGILAFSSLHIAVISESPEKVSSYIDTAIEYNNQALPPFRQAIGNLSSSNCDAVFAHSIITILINLAMRRFIPKQEKPDVTTMIATIFELLQGVRSISKIGQSWFKTDLVLSARNFWITPTKEIDSALDIALKMLDALVDTTDCDLEQQQIFKDAVSMLHFCFRRYNDMKDIASVLSWFTTLDKQFIHALQRRQGLPILITIYWGVLLCELDGKVWWAKNSGTDLVSELLVTLGTTGSHPEWEDILILPRKR
ncbi:C6 transcription factor, partial [Penicillium herquei]